MSVPQTTPPNYRALLVKYMAHVWDEEGATFVPEIEWKGSFTDDEVRELKIVEMEAANVR